MWASSSNDMLEFCNVQILQILFQYLFVYVYPDINLKMVFRMF